MMPPFLLNTPPSGTTWILVAIGGATILYAVFRPSMKKKDPLARSPSASSLSQQRNVERQMQNLLVELSEMARQLTAQLDTRSQKLEMLLQETDAKIAELRQISERAIESPSRIVPPVVESADPQHQDVYALADRGQAAAEIARQLNRPRGEVELILALRGNTKK